MAEKSAHSSRDIIRKRIAVASKLLWCCVENGRVVGMQRFSKRLRAEKEFLESVRCISYNGQYNYIFVYAVASC